MPGAELAARAGADAEVAGAQDVVGDHTERVVVHRLDMQTQSLIRLAFCVEMGVVRSQEESSARIVD